MSPHWTSSVEIHDEHCVPTKGSKCAGTEGMHLKHAVACITSNMLNIVGKDAQLSCTDQPCKDGYSATIPHTLNTDQPTRLLIVQSFILLAHTPCIKTVNKSFKNEFHSNI